jgi:glutathione S-transferase
MATQPTFAYWDIRGFGQPIRFLLAYLKVDHEEKIYSSDNDGKAWFDEKFKLGLDFPNVPYWIDEKVRLTERTAILKHVSRKYDPSLVPPQDKIWQSDMLEGVLLDVWELLVAVCYRPSDDAETSFAETAPAKLGQINTFIGDKSFCIGNSPTYIDFMAYEALHHYRVLKTEAYFAPYPNIVKFMKNFENLAPIKEYMASSHFMKAKCFSVHQKKYHI